MFQKQKMTGVDIPRMLIVVSPPLIQDYFSERSPICSYDWVHREKNYLPWNFLDGNSFLIRNTRLRIILKLSEVTMVKLLKTLLCTRKFIIYGQLGRTP